MIYTIENNIPNKFPECDSCASRTDALQKIIRDMELALQLPAKLVDKIEVDSSCSPHSGLPQSSVTYELAIYRSVLKIQRRKSTPESPIGGFRSTKLDQEFKTKRTIIACPGLVAASRKG